MEMKQPGSGRQSPQQCAFYVARKSRRCRLRPMPGQSLCVEHCPSGAALPSDSRGNRIPCPLDPKHTVYAAQLDKHLTRCNSRPRLTEQPYFQRGVNSCDSADDRRRDLRWSLLSPPEHMRCRIDELVDLVESLVPDSDLADESPGGDESPWPTMAAELAKVAQRAAASLKLKTKEKMSSSEDDGDSSEDDDSGEPRAVTNLRQQANLLALAEKSNLLRSPCAYVEFGAGKGHLCHWVARYWQARAAPATADSPDSNAYLLIDRGSVRNKLDCAHKYSGQRFSRIRVDIADLVLRRLLIQRPDDEGSNLNVAMEKSQASSKDSSATAEESSISKKATEGISSDPPATGGISSDPPATGGISSDPPATGGISSDAPATGGISSDPPATEATVGKASISKPKFSKKTPVSMATSAADVQTAAKCGVTALGKHLCGSATDLALRCLAGLDAPPVRDGTDGSCADGDGGCSDSKRPRIGPECERAADIGPVGGVIALCCHHRCLWSAYVGKQHLASLGIGPEEFHAISRMAGWATCASKAERRWRQQQQDRRELVGLKCKRLIDTGRVAYLTEQLGCSARLVRYAKRSDTPEYTALVFSRGISI